MQEYILKTAEIIVCEIMCGYLTKISDLHFKNKDKNHSNTWFKQEVSIDGPASVCAQLFSALTWVISQW